MNNRGSVVFTLVLILAFSAIVVFTCGWKLRGCVDTPDPEANNKVVIAEEQQNLLLSRLDELVERLEKHTSFIESCSHISSLLAYCLDIAEDYYTEIVKLKEK